MEQPPLPQMWDGGEVFRVGCLRRGEGGGADMHCLPVLRAFTLQVTFPSHPLQCHLHFLLCAKLWWGQEPLPLTDPGQQLSYRSQGMQGSGQGKGCGPHHQGWGRAKAGEVGVDVGKKTVRGISEDTGCCQGECLGKDSWVVLACLPLTQNLASPGATQTR